MISIFWTLTTGSKSLQEVGKHLILCHIWNFMMALRTQLLCLHAEKFTISLEYDLGSGFLVCCNMLKHHSVPHSCRYTALLDSVSNWICSGRISNVQYSSKHVVMKLLNHTDECVQATEISTIFQRTDGIKGLG